MIGLIFKRQSCVFDSSKFKQVLYPQIDLAIRYVIDNGFVNKNFVSFIFVGGEEVTQFERFYDKIQRPIDYGVLERCKIIFRLHYEKKINLLTVYRCLNSLFSWTLIVYFNLKAENRELAQKYIQYLAFELLKDEK